MIGEESYESPLDKVEPKGKVDSSNKDYEATALGVFKREVGKLGLKVRRIAKKYPTIEDLVSDIHKYPPDGVVYLPQHKKFGIVPLMRREKDGITKIIFGLRYTEENSDNPRETSYIKMKLDEEIYPYEEIDEKRVDSDIKREYLLLNRDQFKVLEDLTQSGDAKSKREKRLYILSKRASAEEIYRTIINDAINIKASDIHIEPYAGGVTRIRFRVDGVLKDQKYKFMTIENRKALIQLIKGQAEMDQSEHRRPQDGSIIIDPKEESGMNKDKITIKLDRPKKYNLRVSTMNTDHGEKTVLRILEAREKSYNLERLGYPKKIYQDIQNLIHSPSGIILLTGPTGSGKTTTIYSILDELNTPEVNITTIEDPIEIEVPGINQLKLNEKAGISFQLCLDHVLRQDPDIIFIGEIRDKETASVASQAAKTGHLVVSTLHARDAVGTLLRLQDLGIDNRDISSCLLGVCSQRLIRKLCSECMSKKEYRELAAYSGRDALNKMFNEEIIKIPFSFFKKPDKDLGIKCNHCGGFMEYKGRVVVPELWILGNEERTMIEAGNRNHDEYFNAARNKGMWDLTYSGLRLAMAGKTTLDEIFSGAITKTNFLNDKEYVAKIIPKIKENLQRTKGPGDTTLPSY